MRLIFLRGPADTAQYWHDAEPLIQRCVDHAVRGEFSASDVRHLIDLGRAIGFLEYSDAGEPLLAGALEFLEYPSGMTVANLMALGGRDMARFWSEVEAPTKRYCREAGATYFECSCSPAMQRLIQRSGGWREVYRVLRTDL